MLQFTNTPNAIVTTVRVNVTNFQTKVCETLTFKVELSHADKQTLIDLENQFYNALEEGTVESLNTAALIQDQIMLMLGQQGVRPAAYIALAEWPTEIVGVAFMQSTANPNKIYLAVNGKMSELEIPAKMKQLILRALEVGDSLKPITKFWISLLRNPIVRKETTEAAQQRVNAIVEYVTLTHVDSVLAEEYEELGYSREEAAKLATVPQTPLTREGLIQCKKVVAVEEDKMLYKFGYNDEGEVVRLLKTDVEGVNAELDEETGEVTIHQPTFSEDWIFSPYIYKNGEKFYTGEQLGYVYKIGQIARLENWDSVNTNMNASCVKGLHVGNQAYINSYENDRNATLDCLVSPLHIGAVSDGENVMRVLQFMPIAIRNRKVSNRNLYSSHNYSLHVENQWKKMAEEAVAQHSKEIEALNAKIEFLSNL